VYNITNYNEKMAVDHTVRKRGEYIEERSIGLESAGNRNERKTEAILEEGRFGGSRKM